MVTGKQTPCHGPSREKRVPDPGVKLPCTVEPYLRMATFAAVVRNRSVRGAAGELRITPSAVSQQIRQLEREMGVALFGRAGRRLTLTDAGTAFYGGCVEMIRAAERAREDLAGFQRAPVGELSISAPTGLSSLLAHALRPLLTKAPKLSVRVVLSDDAVDLRARPHRSGGLDLEALARLQLDTPTPRRLVADLMRGACVPRTQGQPTCTCRPRAARSHRAAARTSPRRCPDWR